jgi:hypothetical protein
MALREIAGPAGRLEALLDEPQPDRRVEDDGLYNGQPAGVRAAVVLGHPHTDTGTDIEGRLPTAKALNRMAAPFSASTSAARASAGSFTGGPARRTIFRASDFMRRRYPDARMWAAGSRSVDLPVGRRRRSAYFNAHRHRTTDRDADWCRPQLLEAAFFIHGEPTSCVRMKDMREFMRCRRAEELVIDGAPSVRRQGERRDDRGSAGDWSG